MTTKPTDHEINDFQAGYIRHLNSLSTGSILLITIFLEKVFTQPKWKGLIAVSLGGFLCSLICGAALYTVLTYDEERGGFRPFAVKILVAMWVAFLVGMAALAAFALKNLFN
jgi:hypothetical protein